MADIDTSSKFDYHQCVAKNFDQVLADQIQAKHLEAAQTLFADCINVRALQKAVDKSVEEKKVYGGTAEDAQINPEEPTYGKGTGDVKGMWLAATLVSQEIDDVKAAVQRDLVKAGFPHPEYATILDGVKDDGK